MVCAPTVVEVPRGSVSARRSWPPRCGRSYPENGDNDSDKGVVEEAAASSAACNGGLPQHDPQPNNREDDDDGGEAQPRGHGDAAPPSDGHAEDVMPLAFAAPQSSAVASANGSVEDGELGSEDDENRNKRRLSSAMNPPSKRRAVPARRRFPPGCPRAAVTGISIGGGGASPMFGRGDSNEEPEGKSEGAGGATEARNFSIQESQVVDRVVGGQHDLDHQQSDVTNDSPRRDLSGEMDDRTPLHEWTCISLVAGDGDGRSDCEGSLPKGTSMTPPRGLVSVKKNGKRKLKHGNINKDSLKRSGKESKCGHHVATDQVVEKDDVGFSTKRVIVHALMAPNQCPWIQRKKSIASVSKCSAPTTNVRKKHELEDTPLVKVDVKYEGSLQEGNLRTYARGFVNAKTKGNKKGLVSVKVDVTRLDEIGVFENGTPRNKISATHRRVTRSNVKVKKSMVSRKLRHDGMNKDPLNSSTKESECGNHLLADQTKENNYTGLPTGINILALMAPENCPRRQGKRSIACSSQPLTCSNTALTVREGLCLPDISEGKETIPICVFNTIDGMQLMPFKYTTEVIYPPSYVKAPPKGCDCTNGCSDSSECACAVKNEGEIPYNFNSAIVYTKPVIYECGPSCRCPPTCHNRVSQHGPKIRLEIFKTGKTGWGVRSPSFISSGSFICEYVGEVLQETEAERRENDEYLFDIGRDDDSDEEEGSQSSTSEIVEDVGYTIDAANFGNIGRFINHSCSPNLHAQDVLWDHDDTRVPHVMLFAEKNIRPLQELTYDYNYNIGQVRKNGKEKIKDCFCGSPKCRLRLY